MINIAIVEDHTLFREGLKVLLENNKDYRVVAEFANGREFIESLFDYPIDLVLIDIEMPFMNGIEATAEAKMKLPALKFIALSMYSDQKYYYEMIRAGASGFVLKEATSDELEKAINDVLNDQSYFSPKLLQQVIMQIPELEGRQKTINKLKITERELDVLKLLCQGMTNFEISEHLFLSPKTIETHKTRLLKKTGVKNSTSLILFALKNKLVEF
ncbi:response regulator transcription factor [Roseimarinus sediminis]|jgi:DNA-binding NarL/FixJ family response regulator|uniref:response regulator transcription factor n=1 Tax=Roseimarinus sediminis TaxID=1610899 RepID=UPI003D1ADA82